MLEKPTFDELRDRVQQSIRFYGGSLPESAALVWDGYFAACLEWGLISVDDHANLVSLLPKIDENPVMHIFLGWNAERS